MICGCSSRIISATTRGSSHLTASMPAESPPFMMRSSSAEARSSPSALPSALRRYSVTPRPIAVSSRMRATNSTITFSTVALGTLLRRAIAPVRRFTSRGERNLMTSAASASPSAIISTAAFSAGLRLVEPLAGSAMGEPLLDYLSRPARVVGDDLAYRVDVGVEHVLADRGDVDAGSGATGARLRTAVADRRRRAGIGESERRLLQTAQHRQSETKQREQSG